MTKTKTTTSKGRFWKRLLSQRVALVAAVVVFILLISALFAPWLAPYDPFDQDLRATLQAPDAAHWLGTDALGRDTLSRIIFGARISLQAAVFAVGLAALVGIPLGLIAGYTGGLPERVIMGLVDVLFVMPPIIIAFSILAILGAGLTNVIIAIGITMSTRFVRLTRGVVIAEREELYVDAARVGGVPTRSILFRHLLPNIAPPLIIQTAQMLSVVILVEASLSFLGLGVDISEPSWGRMLAEAQKDISRQPFLPFPPGIALTMTVLAFNLFGDGLRDSLERETGQRSKRAARNIVPTPRIVHQASHTPGHSTNNIPPRPAPQTPVLSVHQLEVRFPTFDGKEVCILQDVSFDVAAGEILGLVGESGCGKSMTALSVMGLIPTPGYIHQGSIQLQGRELVGLRESEMRRVRGKEMAMIFQDPTASLNPSITVGQQLVEPLQRHHGMTKQQARTRAIELLSLVQVPEPQHRIDDYPHQFSGGMAQRVMIARALACNQQLLLADEPTTALDVTVQGQVLDLFADLRQQLGLALLLITHNLGVVAEICDRVVVMYAGQVCEVAPVNVLFAQPAHPYTAALLSTIPENAAVGGRLPILPGVVPDAAAFPDGCRFQSRCPFATDVCMQQHIPLRQLGNGHACRCIRIDEIPTYKDERHTENISL